MKTDKICMMVRTDILNDARVDREAKTLATAGYMVKVINLGEGSKRGNVLYSIIKTFGWPKPGANIISVVFRYVMFMLSSLYLGVMAKAQVYHAHDLSAVIPAFLAARIRRAKYIYDAHELWNEKEKNVIKGSIKRIELYFARRADAVISANKERADIINEELALKRYPIVINNYPELINIERTGYMGNYLLKEGVKNKIIVLYQGVIKSGRSYEAVIEASRYVNDDVIIVFLGKAPSPEYFRQIMDMVDKSARRKIYLHPSVPKEELLQLTASAHIGLVLYENTSRNNYYCAPNKLYEYMMCGIPVITSDFPMLKMVEEEKFGICVNPNDPKGIAAAINRIAADKELYKEYSFNARELAEEKYNWKKESGKLLGLYKSI